MINVLAASKEHATSVFRVDLEDGDSTFYFASCQRPRTGSTSIFYHRVSSKSGSYILLVKQNYLLGFELLIAVLMKSYILWHITPCKSDTFVMLAVFPDISRLCVKIANTQKYDPHSSIRKCFDCIANTPLLPLPQYCLILEAFTNNGQECIRVLLFSSLLPVVCTHETIMFVLNALQKAVP